MSELVDIELTLIDAAERYMYGHYLCFGRQDRDILKAIFSDVRERYVDDCNNNVEEYVQEVIALYKEHPLKTAKL